MKLGLGTVQLGANYGVSNRGGQPSHEEAMRVLGAAASAGIDLLDTAASYGEAETVVGRWLGTGGRALVVTKAPGFGVARLEADHAACLRETFSASLRRLGVGSVYGLLLHSAKDLDAEGAQHLVDAMRGLQASGHVARIGISVYNARELDAAMRLFAPDIVQLPLNVFDQRLLASGHLEALAHRGVEIHVRSIFLQGLLLMRPEELPPALQDAAEPLRHWRRRLTELQLSPLEGALSFAAGLGDVTRVLVGVNSVLELNEVVSAARAARIHDFSSFALQDERLVDPSQWRLKAVAA